jgi:hypothetical protein
MFMIRTAKKEPKVHAPHIRMIIVRMPAPRPKMIIPVLVVGVEGRSVARKKAAKTLPPAMR